MGEDAVQLPGGGSSRPEKVSIRGETRGDTALTYVLFTSQDPRLHSTAKILLLQVPSPRSSPSRVRRSQARAPYPSNLSLLVRQKMQKKPLHPEGEPAWKGPNDTPSRAPSFEDPLSVLCLPGSSWREHEVEGWVGTGHGWRVAIGGPSDKIEPGPETGLGRLGGTQRGGAWEEMELGALS